MVLLQKSMEKALHLSIYELSSQLILSHAGKKTNSRKIGMKRQFHTKKPSWYETVGLDLKGLF